MNDFNFTQECYSKKIQAYIARMHSLSTTVIKVLETCNDPQASANDLKRVISLDPVLTGRVLKLINSAYYSLSKPVSSLTRAIIMLGVNTVKNLALSFSIMGNFNRTSSCLSFSVDDFWTHSLGVGVVAKSLAALVGVPIIGREDFFIAGLLHDLGKLPLHVQLPAEYYRVCETVHSGQEPLHQNESRFLGIDHGAVGKIIAKKWSLGSTLVESLAYHHNPADGTDKNRGFLSVVALANQLVLHLNIGNAGDHFIDQTQIKSLMSEIGVNWMMLNELQSKASDEIQRAKFFLEVAQDG